MRKSKLFLLFMALLTVIVLAACGNSNNASKKTTNSDTAGDGNYKIATVVKLTGVAWFNRMEEGVARFAKDTGNDAYQVGPQKADAALQVQIIEDLIAQKVDAITVVPFSVEALEPVLKKARDAGIVVITHEADGFQNTDFNIEAFDNADYGRFLMDNLAKAMGEEGDYMTAVGSVTSKSHMQWEEAAVKHQEEKYPNMKAVARQVETNDDLATASDKFRETIKAYPSLKGFQGSAGNDVPGAALAAEEMGIAGKISLVGTSVPSSSEQYIESGAISSIAFWDPAEAAYAMNKLAVMILDGKKDEIKDGMDLGVPGYEKLKIVNNKFIFGNAWVGVDKSNLADYDF